MNGSIIQWHHITYVGKDDDGVCVCVCVGDIEDVVGLEGTLQPSGLHQLCQNRNVGKTAPTWTTTTHPSTSASFVLIVTSNTLVPLSHYPTKTSVSGSGRTSNTGSKLVLVQSLPNNNNTTTAGAATTATTAAANPSVNEGGVKGLKVVTNTNSKN